LATTDIIPYEYPDVVAALLTDTGLVTAFEGEIGTEDARLGAIITSISNLFSLDEPTIGVDPMQELRTIARDTQLGNIIKERALYRLYLLVRGTKIGLGGMPVPLWHGIQDDNGEPLLTQEDFIGWFTSKSGLSRASTFRRIRVYQRLAEFGIQGKEAWLRVLHMPGVTQEILKEVAVWERNAFIGVDEKVALGVAGKVLPGQKPMLEALFATNQPVEAVKDAFAPVIRALLDGIKDYPSAKDALNYIRTDVLGTAYVSYRWIDDEQAIGIRVHTPVIEDGELVEERHYETVLYLDDANPPKALTDDLFKRLPIVNKHELPGS